MKRQRVSWSRKMLSGGLIAFLIGIVIVIGFSYPFRVSPYPYWLYRATVDNSAMLCIGILPLGWVTVGVQAIIWRKRFVSAVLIAISIVFTCAGTASLTWTILVTALGFQTHHDTLRTESYVYHLSSEWKIGVGMASRADYLLWQCDSVQIACRIVHSESIPPIYREEDYRAAQAVLVLDPAMGAIGFILDGKRMYTHRAA